MKKFTLVAAAILFAASLLSLVAFWIYNSDNHESVYHRFERSDGKHGPSFNPWALISPIQIESQETKNTVVRFSHKVTYPVAPHFACVGPSDTSAEAAVASEIAKIIADSIREIRYRLRGDYDGQAIAVRNAAHPKTTPLPKPRVDLLLEGTASPEALKYGFAESIKPGHIEEENTTLARERLHRTDSILQRKLKDLGITEGAVSMAWRELQLTDQASVDNVMKDPAILDTMRFVRAEITIVVPQLEVTPMTAPIALPFWLAVLLGLGTLGILLWKRRRPLAFPRFSLGTMEDWITALWFLIEFLLMCFALYFLFAGMMLLFGILAIAFAILSLILLIRTLFSIQWSEILSALRLLFHALGEWLRMLGDWWRRRCTCQKILLIQFLLDIAALVTWLLGWWHICF